MKAQDVMRLLWLLYQVVGAMTGLWVYGGFALYALMTESWGLMFGWVFIVGPIVSPLAGIIWPLYWGFTLSQWGGV